MHSHLATEFLGVGFDSLSKNDLKFRAPILKLEKEEIWFRPYNSCSEFIINDDSEDKTGKKANNEVTLKVDTSVALVGSGNLGVDVKNNLESDTDKSMKSYSKHIVCYTISAGIMTYANWKLTEGFRKSIEELEKLKAQEHKLDNCDDIENQCNYKEAWMRFVKEFGTDVVLSVKMGGRIINNILIPKNAENILKDQNISLTAGVEVSLKAADVGVNTNIDVGFKNTLKEFKESCESKQTVWGGLYKNELKLKKNLKEWVKSLDSNGMPLETVIEPIYKFIPESLKKDYQTVIKT